MRQAFYARANIPFSRFRVIYLSSRVNARVISLYNNIEVHDKYGRCKPHDIKRDRQSIFVRISEFLFR